MTSLLFEPILKSFAIDISEQNIYFGSKTNPMMVARLQASNGAITSVQSFETVDGIAECIKIYPLSDNSGYFLTGRDTSSSLAVVCKYLFYDPLNTQCQVIDTYGSFASHYLMLSDSQVFSIGSEPSSPFSLLMYKYAFGSAGVDWADKISCISGTCSSSESESLTSADNSKIYTLFLYGNANKNFYFFTLNATNGNVIGSRYKSSASCSNVYGSKLNGNYIISTPLCGGQSLALINLATSAITIKAFAGSYLFGCGVESNSGRYICAGYTSPYGVISAFMPEALNANTQFVSAGWTMNILAENLDVIISASGISLPSIISRIVSLPVYTNQTVSYTPTNLQNSDVYFQTGDQSFSIIEKAVSSLTPDLPCSSSGLTTIAFSINNYNGTIAPSWITVDSTTGALSVSAPEVSVDAEFSFYISSSIVGVTGLTNKVIKIVVLNCVAQNCQTCSISSASLCATCISGYILNSGVCYSSFSSTSTSTTNISDNANLLSKLVQVLVIASAFINILSAIVSSSSIASLWSMINQLQLLFLLLLTRAYIPSNVQIVITGSQFVLNPFNSIVSSKGNLYDSVRESFSFKLTSSSLESFEINSNSTFYNMYSFLIIHFIIALLHAVLAILSKLISRCSSRFNCCKIGKCCEWILNKAFKCLTFGFYIRSFMEVNQYLLISLSNELYNFNSSSTYRVTSLIIALLLLFICAFLIVNAMVIALSSYQVDDNNHNILGEFIIGLKIERKFKIYTPAMLIRRAVFVILLITLVSISSKFLIGVLSFFQFIYAVLLVIQRPFKECKVNLIEIVNEIYFFSLLFSLFFLNIKDDWNSLNSLVYMWILASNSMVDCLIILTDGIIKTMSKCCKKKVMPAPQNNNTVDISQVTPVNIKLSSKRHLNSAKIPEQKARANRESAYNNSIIEMLEERKERFSRNRYQLRF